MQCSAHKQSVRNNNIRYNKRYLIWLKTLKHTVIYYYKTMFLCNKQQHYKIKQNYKIKHADIKLNAITYRIKEIHL